MVDRYDEVVAVERSLDSSGREIASIYEYGCGFIKDASRVCKVMVDDGETFYHLATRGISSKDVHYKLKKTAEDFFG